MHPIMPCFKSDVIRSAQRCMKINIPIASPHLVFWSLFTPYLHCALRENKRAKILFSLCSPFFSFYARQSEFAHASTWSLNFSLHSTAHLFSPLWPSSPFFFQFQTKIKEKKCSRRLEKKRISCSPEILILCDAIETTDLFSVAPKVCHE